MFKIQIYHPGSGCWLATNHEAEDLKTLQARLNEPVLAGPHFRIVDHNGNVHYGPVAFERNGPSSVEELAESFGVPVVGPPDEVLADEAGCAGLSQYEVGYTLEAIHQEGDKPIISLRLDEAPALEIKRKLWPGVDFWAAPGGASMLIETVTEAETINRILGNCWISFEPSRHRWLFHVHLV